MLTLLDKASNKQQIYSSTWHQRHKKNLPNGLACIYTDFFFLFVKSSANLNLTVTYSTFKHIKFSHYSNFHFSYHFSSFFFHIIRGRQICIRKKTLDLHWIWQTMSNYAVLFHILNKIQLNSLAVARIGSILRNRWPDWKFFLSMHWIWYFYEFKKKIMIH